MITIGLNKKLDKEVFRDFWGFSVEGADFGDRGIKRVHPTITRKTAMQYIDTYYVAHANELVAAQRELQDALDRTSKEYFSAVAGVFGDDYSSAQYMGLLSIFDCNPRYVDQKKFQVFYQRDMLGKLEVVYHEVLHFMFFGHAARVCPDIVSELDTNGGPYWALSEIFNVIILNRPEFQQILHREEQMFYPMLKNYVEPIRALHERYADDFCGFLRAALTYLQKERAKHA